VSPTVEHAPQAPAPSARVRRKRRERTGGAATSLVAQGHPLVWLTGAGLVICIAMVLGLLALVFWQGFATFWPGRLQAPRLHDGTRLLGEVTRVERYRPGPEVLAALPPERRTEVERTLVASDGEAERRLLRTGNYELTNEHFHWVSDFEIAAEERPEWAVVVERLTWGRFYGTPTAFELDGERVAGEPAAAYALFREHHDEVRARWSKRRALETHATGAVNARLERARLALRAVQLEHGADSQAYRVEAERAARIEREGEGEFARLRAEIETLERENARFRLVVSTADGVEKPLALDEIVRLVPANRLGWLQRVGTYLARWREFLLDEPREANSEGGVFPAIFGTVVMTLLMTLLVVPVGVLAALYLREYAKAGWLVSGVRIAINNLAGVPSIVFGVFGLGFFCYLVGGSIDQLFFTAKLPSPTYGTGGIAWAALTLALLTLPVVIVATEEALAAVPNTMREGSFGCGASKWQTIQRIVLPHAMPGITTGAILAMARGAGEVAPLMLVGAVKLAPELPLDGTFPFVHPERSFMHLGFHIYDLGFQSQNSEAAKPMVFTTTLLLITIVVALNLTAITVRARLHRRFKGSHIG
jgi:phosphate transport system permease protein